MTETNLVIDSNAGNLSSGRKFVEIAENSSIHGIKFVYLGKNKLSPDVIQYSFKQSGQDGEITFTDDYENDLEYLTIRNMSPSDSEQLVKIFNSNFNIRSLEEVRRLLTEDLKKNRRYLIHLGLMEAQHSNNQDTLAIVREALSSDNSETVLSAIRILQLIDLPRLHKELEAVLETSNNAQVRHSAALALAQMSV